VAARGVEPQKNQTEVVVAVHQQNAANVFWDSGNTLDYSFIRIPSQWGFNQ
jgi:hypothetical protein